MCNPDGVLSPDVDVDDVNMLVCSFYTITMLVMYSDVDVL